MEQDKARGIKWFDKAQKGRSEIVHNSFVNPKYEETKKRIQRVIEKWADALELNSWRCFSFNFDDQYKQDNPLVVADCDPDWRYMIAEVTFYLPACVERTDEELTHTLIHEVLHAYLNELTTAHNEKDSEGHEEHVCTMLAMIIRKVRNATAEGRLNAEATEELVGVGNESS